MSTRLKSADPLRKVSPHSGTTILSRHCGLTDSWRTAQFNLTAVMVGFFVAGPNDKQANMSIIWGV